MKKTRTNAGAVLLCACLLLPAGCAAPERPSSGAVPEAARPSGAVQIALIRDYMGADCNGTDGGLFGGKATVRIQTLDLTCDGGTVTGTVEGIQGDSSYSSYFSAAVRGVVGMAEGEPYVERLTYERQDGWIALYLNRVEQAAVNEQRQVLARRWYDLPGLSHAAQPVSKKIDAFFEQKCEAFMADDYFWEACAERMDTAGQDRPYILQPLHDTMSTQLTYLDMDILSVRQVSSWNAGGMNSISYYGYTFDLRSGDPLGLDYFVTADSADFNRWVTDQVCGIGWKREEVEGYYSGLALSDYRYAYDGESVLLFLDNPRVTGSAPVLRYPL